MRFQVPQNVQREDQILGPLTMKQLGIAIVGLGLGWVVWATMDPTVATPLVIILVAFTICFLFVRINEMPFYKYLAELALFILKPRTRFWQKGAGEISPFALIRIQKNKNKHAKKQVTHVEKKSQSLNELSRVLDTRGRWSAKDLQATHTQEEVDSMSDAEFFEKTMSK